MKNCNSQRIRFTKQKLFRFGRWKKRQNFSITRVWIFSSLIKQRESFHSARRGPENCDSRVFCQKNKKQNRKKKKKEEFKHTSWKSTRADTIPLSNNFFTNPHCCVARERIARLQNVIRKSFFFYQIWRTLFRHESSFFHKLGREGAITRDR